MWTTVGHCPKCGAPIYSEAVWHGVTPPPARYSCGCTMAAHPVTTTTITVPVPEPLPHVQKSRKPFQVRPDHFWYVVREAQEFYDDVENIINHIAFKLGMEE
jgi:hypothetical protein